ncbi:MAG: protein kinase [Myxococcales bacterium]|nr:protein kinase [Myxococcales bacterium]
MIRVKLACADEPQFQTEFASRIAEGFFVPTESPQALGQRLSLELELLDGKAVRGEAVVMRHGQPGKRSGMLVHLLELAPDSVQFPLKPHSQARPPVFATPAPSAPAPSPTPRPDALPTRVQDAPAGPAAPEEWSGGLRQFDVLRSYQLLKRLGGGGMAEVFLARSTLGEGVEKLVALKTTLPQFGPDTPFGALFLNEARISVTLQHPNVVQVFDYGEAAGRPFLAMEFVPGRNLGNVLRRMQERGLEPRLDLAVAVGIEVCKALEYVHEKKDLDGKPLSLVHRDVSPGNVIFSERGEVKVVDFGVAAASTGTRAAEMLVGKYAYMAPEQAKGSVPAPNWDIYGLGAVLHEMSTLRPLFAGDTSKEAILERRKERHLPPSSVNAAVPAALDRAVLTATDPDSSRRYASARELRQALDAVQGRVGRCDCGAVMGELFGDELIHDQMQIEALMVRARRHSPRAPLDSGTTVLRPLRRLRRRLASTRFAMELARRPRLVWAVAALLVLALGGGGFLGVRSYRREAAFASRIALADERIASGRLVGAGGDEALDHLLEARKARPDDPRALERVRSLADKFEELGQLALSREDRAEAAVHFEASLKADPGRAKPAQRLEEIEKWIREHGAGKVRASPAP